MNSLIKTNNEVSERNFVMYHPIKDKSWNYRAYLLLGLMILLWPILLRVIHGTDETAGYIDPNIWLLVLLSLISFMVVTALCWWLLHQFWMSLGLPAIESMVLQFKNLSLWQQFGFYWLSFVSLLLAAVGVLSAVL